MKPVKIDDDYYTFELVKTNPSTVKSFQEAKELVLPLFVQSQKRSKLLKLAQDSVKTFTGTTTEFITASDAIMIKDISLMEANEFLKQLFITQEKRSYIDLGDGKIVLYDILEQKMLTNKDINQDNSIVRLKSAMFNKGLLKTLKNKYKTEIFIKGL